MILTIAVRSLPTDESRDSLVAAASAVAPLHVDISLLVGATALRVPTLATALEDAMLRYPRLTIAGGQSGHRCTAIAWRADRCPLLQAHTAGVSGLRHGYAGATCIAGDRTTPIRATATDLDPHNPDEADLFVPPTASLDGPSIVGGVLPHRTNSGTLHRDYQDLCEPCLNDLDRFRAGWHRPGSAHGSPMLRGPDLFEQILMPVDEGAMDAGRVRDAGYADLVTEYGGAVQRFQDAFPATRRVGSTTGGQGGYDGRSHRLRAAHADHAWLSRAPFRSQPAHPVPDSDAAACRWRR